MNQISTDYYPAELKHRLQMIRLPGPDYKSAAAGTKVHLWRDLGCKSLGI